MSSNNKPTWIGFGDFVLSRSTCSDIGERLRIDTGRDDAVPGFVYDNDCYIEQQADGSFYLILYSDEFESASLADLEPILYAWSLTEAHYPQGPDEERLFHRLGEWLNEACENPAPDAERLARFHAILAEEARA